MYFKWSDVWLLRAVVTGMLRWRLQLITGCFTVFLGRFSTTSDWIQQKSITFYPTTHRLVPQRHQTGAITVGSSFKVSHLEHIHNKHAGCCAKKTKQKNHHANFSSRGSLWRRLILDVCKESAGSIVRPGVRVNSRLVLNCAVTLGFQD